MPSRSAWRAASRMCASETPVSAIEGQLLGRNPPLVCSNPRNSAMLQSLIHTRTAHSERRAAPSFVSTRVRPNLALLLPYNYVIKTIACMISCQIDSYRAKSDYPMPKQVSPPALSTWS
jgi:hypothetical protein